RGREASTRLPFGFAVARDRLATARLTGGRTVLAGRLSAPGTPATEEKRRGAAFPGGCARGVFPRRLIGGSAGTLLPPLSRNGAAKRGHDTSSSFLHGGRF